MVDAFFTRRGLPILEDESYSEKGFSENVDKRNTSWSYGTGKEGEITAAGIYKMYCNREPRFYNAVSFHGSWQECAKRPYDFFYNGKDNIRTSSPHDAPQNGYLVRKSLCMTDNKKQVYILVVKVSLIGWLSLIWIMPKLIMRPMIQVLPVNCA